MGQPQVSAQALYNEAARHKTWESLEAQLMNLIVSGQVLDYKKESDHVSVTLDGTTKPVKLPIRVPEPRIETEKAVPVSIPASQASATATLVADRPKPPKVAQGPVKVKIERIAATAQAPVGVVALIGLKNELYESHLRRFLGFRDGFAGENEAMLSAWFGGLK